MAARISDFRASMILRSSGVKCLVSSLNLRCPLILEQPLLYSQLFNILVVEIVGSRHVLGIESIVSGLVASDELPGYSSPPRIFAGKA